MTTPIKFPMSTAYIGKCLEMFNPTFRIRKYAHGKTALFMYIRKAVWSDLYPSRLEYTDGQERLSYTHLGQLVRKVVPEAIQTSGGVGDGTWRLPDYVTHKVGTLPRKPPDQLYRKLHRFTLTIRRDGGNIITHTQKDKGDRSPVIALRRAFSALGQLVEPNDRDITITIINRGTGKPIMTSPVITLGAGSQV